MKRVLRRALSLFLIAGAALAGAQGASAPPSASAPALHPAAAPAPAGAPTATAPKVLRYAFLIAETGFDPAQISDLYSRIVTAHLFEALYKYDYLARPYKIKPHTAAALPEVTNEFKTWTIRIQPGIHFVDDPAFKGRKRELVAEDYVYAIKRTFDPTNKSPGISTWQEAGIIGLDELRERAIKNKTPFDYDTPIDGLKALDRYTLQFNLKAPRPRLLFQLADSSTVGAVAREVIEAYAGDTMAHPVGTGPFRLAEWRRSSRIVLERNPNYRELLYDAEPQADDAEGQAILQRFKGRRLPMVDRVEISIIEASQPRWLAFLNGEIDYISVPGEFASIAAPNNQLAPNLAKRNLKMYRTLLPDRVLLYYNMEDPVVGGYTADKVALRRALGLAMDIKREITLVRRGQAIPAQSMISPHTFGYDDNFKSENGDYNLPRAKALLDLFGYVDRDGDGWRDRPDGQPLVIDYASQPDESSRQFDELWKHDMDALGVRTKIVTAKWPEQLKRARAGQLMTWQLGYSASNPDVQDAFQAVYGPAAGGQNLPRFKLDAFDRLYDRMQSLPDGPERLQAINDANKLLLAYAPMKYSVHRVALELVHPWLAGYRRPPFGNQWWQYVDVDGPKRDASKKR
ncbi:ABC transporter substrate-binding protein [Aquabacterium humicola]|uniref:ABC transporter substrate-binding protein n=1 Tax=Aquabacterium humicola TaxID=3237377 RepID=UPI002543D904|nr:ABC transporter substrate-binding protein [Rubrivivax pictus]